MTGACVWHFVHIICVMLKIAVLACAGTPIQNNMAELFGIMSLLDPEEFGDEDAFLERYGGGRSNPMPDPEQVHALQVRARDHEP